MSAPQHKRDNPPTATEAEIQAAIHRDAHRTSTYYDGGCQRCDRGATPSTSERLGG